VESRDADLLERFLAHRDNVAFETLVRRHGPMVLGVCQRLLRNHFDAEDAFQATFLVFVRKAAAIRPRSNVGNWLYGVAHKTSLKARAMNDRRRIKERQAGSAMAAPAGDSTWTSVLDVLDEELSALPEKYRTALVLCDLEGVPYRAAAAQLGCPRGTISGRLTRGRLLLARRLARRGVVVLTGALAAALSRRAAAALPPGLLARVVRFGREPAQFAGVASVNVLLLAEGVLKMLFLTRLKTLTGVVLAAAVVVASGWLCAAQFPAQSAGHGVSSAPPTVQEKSPPAAKPGAETEQTTPREAEFIVHDVDPVRRTVSLVVAGTDAPVLTLPLEADDCVLFAGLRTDASTLRRGAQVRLRMDPKNRSIRELRVQGPNIRAELHGTLIRTKALAAAEIKPPTTAEVLRALPALPRGVPGLYEATRDDVEVTAEKLVDEIDPARFYPLVGRARLHRLHWKCTVRYNETEESSYPFPFLSRQPRVQVVYIDRDYLILQGEK
jgi:RNA polymerase sigma factor (sigma-70 family)